MNKIEKIFKGIFFAIKVGLFLWVAILGFTFIGAAYYVWIDLHLVVKVVIIMGIILLVLKIAKPSPPVDNHLPDDHRKLSNLFSGQLKSMRYDGDDVVCKECGMMFWSDRVFYLHYGIPDCSHHEGVQTRDEYLASEKWHSSSSNIPMATAVEYKDFEIEEDNRWL